MSQVILPTATNFLTMLLDRVLQARRKGVTAEISVQSQRRRAWQIVNETGVLPIQEVVSG